LILRLNFRGGIRINELELSNLCGKACLLDARGLNVIDMSVFLPEQSRREKLLLYVPDITGTSEKIPFIMTSRVWISDLCNYHISRKVKNGMS